MSKFLRIMLCFGLLLVSPLAHAQEEPAPEAPADLPSNLFVENAHAYATAPSQKNGAVFLQIRNTGDNDEITAAATDVAARAELHTHVMDGDVMQMKQVESFAVPGNEVLLLEPTGNHIMLMDLKAPLEEGSTFILTLTSRDHGALEVNVPVVNPGDSPEDHDHYNDPQEQPETP